MTADIIEAAQRVCASITEEDIHDLAEHLGGQGHKFSAGMIDLGVAVQTALAASQPAPAADTGQAVALRRLLDACLLEFGWNPDANPDDPCGDDKDCQIQWGDLFAANDALAAPHPAPLDAERVRGARALLDMSNMLRHAFISGFEAKGGTVTEAIGDWPQYDPSKCAAYPRLEALLAHPAPLDAERVREEVSEGLEILDNLQASIRKHGNYSEESTLTFLDQAALCLRAALRQKEGKTDG